MNKDIETWMKERASRLLLPIKDILPEHFYLAGGCFGKTVNDLDLFPVTDQLFKLTKHEHLKAICQTPNAETWTMRGNTIQMCNYHHGALELLIRSFDFAHIQAGVKVYVREHSIQITDTAMTPDCIAARAIGDSWYTGSAYPLSSLVRLSKYHKRSAISSGRTIVAIINIVADIAERGFFDYEDFKRQLFDYEDFKRQLDAVDLGLVPEQLSDIELSELTRLFSALRKDSD